MMDKEQSQCLGVSIGATGVCVVGANDELQNVPSHCPPASLLPRLTGELIGTTLGDRMDPRGTGLPWPRSARLDAQSGVARLPSSIAWLGLEQDDKEWSWRPDLSRPARTLRPSEAISGLVDVALRFHGNADLRLSDNIALVVPNSLTLDQQERLLRALKLRGISGAMLLWRPIAAVLSWLKQHRSRLAVRSDTQGESVGHVLALHLGLESFEADFLEIVSWREKGVQYVLPARRLPRIPTLYESGLRAVEAAVMRPKDDSESSAWYRMWGTSWLADTLVERSPSSEKIVQEVIRPQQPCRLTRLRESFGGKMTRPSRKELALGVERGLDSWCQCIRAAIGDLRLCGVVVTGDLCRLQSNNGSLVDRIVESTARNSRRECLLVDQEMPIGTSLLARGAAFFLDQHLKDLPTYLDTLPAIETLVMAKTGEPHWQDLVDRSDPYVLGGRTQKFTPADLNLRIRREEKYLNLTVAQEGHETVREVTRDFQHPFKDDVDVQLQVEIVAGQGNPRVEVLPKDAAVFNHQRLYLDWNRAKDSGKTRTQAADDIPRTYPPLEPRVASANRWLSVSGLMDSVLMDFNRGRFASTRIRLEQLKDVLREKDPEYADKKEPQHATVVDCEGNLPRGASRKEVFEQFIATLDSRFATGVTEPPKDLSLRVLGYCSAQSPRLMEYLRTQLPSLHRMNAALLNAALVAYGNCLRDSKDIAGFAKAMAKDLQPSSDWMRALYRMLCYRQEAAEVIPSAICEQIAGACFERIREQVEQDRQASIIYRHGSMCIAYLLRRRRFDDGYMNPEGKLACGIKAFLKKTIQGMESRQIDCLGGFVDLPLVTRRIIDYIDRRGKGRIQLVD